MTGSVQYVIRGATKITPSVNRGKEKEIEARKMNGSYSATHSVTYSLIHSRSKKRNSKVPVEKTVSSSSDDDVAEEEVIIIKPDVVKLLDVPASEWIGLNVASMVNKTIKGGPFALFFSHDCSC